MRLYTCAFILIVFPYAPGFCEVKPPIVNPGVLTQTSAIGDCHACKLFVESFKNGLERTSRGKYEGGDAAWEEEKLKKSYLRSEMRLIDSQDNLCREEPKYDVQCHNIAEKAEEFIEHWWSEHLDEKSDLFTYICVDNMSLCCPEHHYGKDCTPCPGDHSNICNGHGKCRGDGTRKGNGTCLCNSGYKGEMCDRCEMGFYLSLNDGKTSCLPCHKGCSSDCRGGSPKDCVTCRPGYVFESDEGCTDVDECEDLNRCERSQFCVNSEGSYTCYPCDKACEACYGDGPDLCRKCAKGYTKKGEICAREREDEDNSDQLTTASDINDEL